MCSVGLVQVAGVLPRRLDLVPWAIVNRGYDDAGQDLGSYRVRRERQALNWQRSDLIPQRGANAVTASSFDLPQIGLLPDSYQLSAHLSVS